MAQVLRSNDGEVNAALMSVQSQRDLAVVVTHIQSEVIALKMKPGRISTSDLAQLNKVLEGLNIWLDLEQQQGSSTLLRKIMCPFAERALIVGVAVAFGATLASAITPASTMLRFLLVIMSVEGIFIK